MSKDTNNIDHSSTGKLQVDNAQLPTPTDGRLPSLKDLNLIPQQPKYPTPEEQWLQHIHSFSAPIQGHRQPNPWLPSAANPFELQALRKTNLQLSALPAKSSASAEAAQPKASQSMQSSLATVMEVRKADEPKKKSAVSESRRLRNREAAIRYRNRQVEHQQQLEGSITTLRTENQALMVQLNHKQAVLQKMRNLLAECLND